MENAVPKEVTRHIVSQQLEQWRALLESDRVAMLVANAIGDDEGRKDAIRKEAERATKAIECLNGELEKLNALQKEQG